MLKQFFFIYWHPKIKINGKNNLILLKCESNDICIVVLSKHEFLFCFLCSLFFFINETNQTIAKTLTNETIIFFSYFLKLLTNICIMFQCLPLK